MAGRKNLKYSTEAAKTVRLTGSDEIAEEAKSGAGSTILRVSISEGVKESRITELWDQQGAKTER